MVSSVQYIVCSLQCVVGRITADYTLRHTYGRRMYCAVFSVQCGVFIVHSAHVFSKAVVVKIRQGHRSVIILHKEVSSYTSSSGPELQSRLEGSSFIDGNI